MGEGNVYKWSFIDRISIALINFGVNIALARMLTADDFGLLAMIAIFIAVATDLSNCGLSDGLVHKTHPTETDYSTVFVFNTCIGFFFGIVFFLSAPLIARFFGHEELVGIMRIVAICFIFQMMSYVQEVRLLKNMRMRTICFVRVGATVTVSIMGLVTAALGYGYKALIFTQLVLSVFMFLYYMIASRWFPKISFSVTAFKEFFNYGIHLMLAYLTTLIGKNINTFVLGRYYSSPSMSGVYFQGAKLASVPFGVTETSLNTPFFVVASNEEDSGRVRELIRRMMSTIISVNGCIMLLLLVVAAPAIELFYGDKWLAAIPVFAILSVAEFLFCVKAYMQTICKVHARTVFVRNMGVAEVAVQLSLLALFYKYGILWIAWTQVMGIAFSLCVYLFYCRKFTRLSIWGMLGVFVRSLWLPGIAAAVAIVLKSIMPVLPPFAECVVIVLVFGAVVIGLGEFFKPKVYSEARAYILKRRK